jgi:hypothetical protein
MMARTQITLDPETQRRARQRASDMGLSFAEYVRRLVVRDLGDLRPASNPAIVFNLGASGSSDIAGDKDARIAAAFASDGRKPAGVPHEPFCGYLDLVRCGGSFGCKQR